MNKSIPALLMACCTLFLGCDFQPRPIEYEIGNFNSSHDFSKQFSVGVKGGHEYIYTFTTPVSNTIDLGKELISINVINRNDHNQEFQAYTNGELSYYDLQKGNSVEVYNGPLLVLQPTNRANRLRVMNNDDYTFFFKVTSGFTNLPMAFEISTFGK